MKWLLTNDDGLFAPGMEALVTFARTSLCGILFSERPVPPDIAITVIAPQVEQSAKSHSIELKQDIGVRLETLAYAPDIKAYGVSSSPADCVRFGVCGLEETYDLVLSGINRGYNIGGDILYSGTVSAAMEAMTTGIPAIALSMDATAFDAPHEQVHEALCTAFRYLASHRLLERHTLYNINIPLAPRGVRITRQGPPFYLDHFRPTSESAEQYHQIGYCAHVNRHLPELDTDSVMDGYISIQPLTLDRTHLEVYHALREDASIKTHVSL